MRDKILVVNPGSTSTKIAMYADGGPLWEESIDHPLDDLARFERVYDQLDMRHGMVVRVARAHGESLDDLAAVAARGGPFARVRSGAYEVNERMLHTMEHSPLDQHASLTGAGIAWRIVAPRGVKAYIYDAVTVDEMIPLVRVTGLPEIERRGQGHNLNMRAAALAVCGRRGLDYHSANILVAHLGGGITLSLHSGGRIVDMVSDDEGPFAPERAGGLPGRLLAELCCDNPDRKAILRRLQRTGGLIAHFGTADSRELERRIDAGDQQAELVYDAMALNVAKSLAGLAVVVNGKIDCTVLTGGIARSRRFTDAIAARIAFLGPVELLPGENEMRALYEGVLRVLRGEEQAHRYE